ncbi:MAG: ATP-binding protein [Zhongshania sp.]|uniref:AAA family ATPase n=1 Tax=Zhongshania sp. TaxID=1971902 RepID=UPI002618BF3B|nr:ATP-binding protein [Zhongshania sp.]MDF1691740.1 ATP-binding protein [Zhongshania sp.]
MTITEIDNISGMAPLTNMALTKAAVERAQNRAESLPGMVVMFGPSGFGKSYSATFVANTLRAHYVECRSSWTKKALLEAILLDMGITAASTIYKMTDQISEELAQSQRPLIIDEVDHIVDKKAVEIIRDIYEGSKAPMLLIGEEKLPAKLKRWERFDGRILDWVPAQPAGDKDTASLCRVYARGIEIKPDLQREITKLARGSVRRICVNLDKVRVAAEQEGWDSVDKKRWGSRGFYTGQAPARKLV